MALGGTSRSRSCTTWSGPSSPTPATLRPTSSSAATTATWASRRLAKATFERWTGRHPEDADMLINAGLTLFDAADFAEAYGFFEKAVEAATEEEQRSGALTFRANALDMLGRYDEAVAAYEEVIARPRSGGRPTPTSASATPATATWTGRRPPSGGAWRSAPARPR